MRNPLYVVEQGAKLTRESRLVVVTKDDAVLARVPVIQVSQVVIFGNVQVTTPTLRLLLDEGVEVIWMLYSLSSVHHFNDNGRQRALWFAG